MIVDLLIKNAKVFNCYFKKFINSDIYIKDGKFLYVYDSINTINAKKVIDAKHKYIIPGLIDIHMHIESSMTTPYQFAQGAIKSGTTTIVSDPHEIANVFGLQGIKEMIKLSQETPINIFYGIPSSVPATSPELETTGGEITVEEVRELLHEPSIICLGEVMNFKELLGDEDTKTNQIIKEIKKNKHLKIEGHCPKLVSTMLSEYISRGVDADHTQQTVELLDEKIKKGMFIELQKKSINKETVSYLTDNQLYEHFALVTDDMMADKLLKCHLNELVKQVIDLGMSPEMAIYTATYTPAMRMNLYDRGSIAPGKIADFIMLNDLNSFEIEAVYKNGIEYNINDSYLEDILHFSSNFYNSVHLNELSENDLTIDYYGKSKIVCCQSMHITESTTFTDIKEVSVEINDNKLNWEKSNASLIAVFDRHKNSGNKALGLVTGSGIKKGALATTYAHDHHNLTVTGRNKRDMIIAANWVINNGGGVCVVNNGEVLASLRLPIAGILSDQPLDKLGQQLAEVKSALYDLGYRHHNIIMSMSTLSLPVSPRLKITDKGLIDVMSQQFVNLIIEER